MYYKQSLSCNIEKRRDTTTETISEKAARRREETRAEDCARGEENPDSAEKARIDATTRRALQPGQSSRGSGGDGETREGVECRARKEAHRGGQFRAGQANQDRTRGDNFLCLLGY